MKGGGGGEKKMTVEEYVEFFVSKNSTASTIPYLNQILHIHGFRKLHKTHKKIVGEAVDSLELLDLSRSTLKQTGISSSSSSSSATTSLNLDEVITDIEALKWQECCLTSLQIINSDQVTQSVTKPNKRKRTKTMRMKKKSSKFGHYDDDDDVDVETTTIQDFLGKKKKKKKKKSIRSVNGLVFD